MRGIRVQVEEHRTEIGVHVKQDYAEMCMNFRVCSFLYCTVKPSPKINFRCESKKVLRDR